MKAISQILNNYGKNITLTPVNDYFKMTAPFYHNDGDMIDLFVKELPDDRLLIFDDGLSLMHLSYTYNIDSDRKLDILNKIVKKNYIENEDGNLFIKTSVDDFIRALNQFCLTIAKITNLNILTKEIVSSLFYEHVDEYMLNNIGKTYKVTKNFAPNSEKIFPNNYKIETKKPIFIFPIKDNLSAARATNGCNEISNLNISHYSVGVCEDLDSLNKVDKYFLVGAIDKTYPEINSFKSQLPNLIKRFAG